MSYGNASNTPDGLVGDIALRQAWITDPVSTDANGVRNFMIQDSVINLQDGDSNNVLGRSFVIHHLDRDWERIACGNIVKGK